MFFATWCISHWEVASRVQLDEYGHHPDHPNYQLDIPEDYSDEIPEDRRNYTVAMRYAEAWNLTMDTILDMPYTDFYERTLHWKSIKLVRPVWVGSVGEKAFIIERSSNKRFNRAEHRRRLKR